MRTFFKALLVAKARLKLADVDETKPVGPEDKGGTFTVALKAGTYPLTGRG